MKPAPKSKKKKSESTALEIIDITKPGSGEENIEPFDPILHGATLPMVGLHKINSPDEETKAAPEVL